MYVYIRKASQKDKHMHRQAAGNTNSKTEKQTYEMTKFLR